MTIKTNKMTVEQIKEKLDSFKNVSTKIRYLNSLDYTRSEISKLLNVRYQHVRNVLITPITKQAEQF